MPIIDTTGISIVLSIVFFSLLLLLFSKSIRNLLISLIETFLLIKCFIILKKATKSNFYEVLEKEMFRAKLPLRKNFFMLVSARNLMLGGALEKSKELYLKLSAQKMQFLLQESYYNSFFMQLVLEGKFEEACSFFNKNRMGEQPNAYQGLLLSRGMYYYLCQQYEKSKSFFLQALSKDNLPDPCAYYYLMKIAEDQKDTSLAEQYKEKLKTTDESNVFHKNVFSKEDN